jgi:hypothetical protein
MAQQDYTSLIILAGAGALAWYGYEQGWFANLFSFAAAAPTPAPVSTGTIQPCVAPSTMVGGICTAPLTSNPPVQTSATPATTEYGGQADVSSGGLAMAIQLAQQTATPNNPPQLNIDQWAYYYAKLPNVTPLTGDQVEAMLSAAGATGANRSYVLMAPAQFVELLNTAAGVTGLSGLGHYPGIPASMIHGGW